MKLEVIRVNQKRYQTYNSNGITWTKWFKHSGNKTKWQADNKLKNEYRTIIKTIKFPIDYVPTSDFNSN